MTSPINNASSENSVRRLAEKVCKGCNQLYRKKPHRPYDEWVRGNYCSHICQHAHRVIVAKQRDRICTLCKRLLPAVNFGDRKVGGRRSRCFDCERVYKRAMIATGHFKDNRKKKPSPSTKVKNHARHLLQAAVRRGGIIRKDCEHCGAKKTDGHHSDYSKPLDVIWVCRPCHMKLHRIPTNTPYDAKEIYDKLRRKASE